MVKKDLGVASAKELGGATVCVQTGTTTELNLADYFRTNKLDYNPVVFEKLDETLRPTTPTAATPTPPDVSRLYAERLKLGNPAEHVVLPEVISKEPLGPAVRQGDAVGWTSRAGRSTRSSTPRSSASPPSNVDEMLKSTNPEIRRLLGKEGDFGKGIGVDNDWAYQAIKQVGNYGEIFERNVGSGSRLKIARGLNRLWKEGRHAIRAADPLMGGRPPRGASR